MPSGGFGVTGQPSQTSINQQIALQKGFGPVSAAFANQLAANGWKAPTPPPTPSSAPPSTTTAAQRSARARAATNRNQGSSGKNVTPPTTKASNPTSPLELPTVTVYSSKTRDLSTIKQIEEKVKNINTSPIAIDPSLIKPNVAVQPKQITPTKKQLRSARKYEKRENFKLAVNYPYPSSPLGNFLQNATVRTVITSKDIKKIVIQASDKVEAINEVDLCNLISYFLTQNLPSGSNVEKQFQQVKEKAAELLQKIEDTEKDIINTPLKNTSIPTNPETFATYFANPPKPTNVAAQNPNYGAGITGAGLPPERNPAAATGGDKGTSAEAQPGYPLTADNTLKAIRSVKGLIEGLNIPGPVLRVIPGGGKLLNSLKRLNEQIPTNITSIPNQDIVKIFNTFKEVKLILSGVSTAENPADLLSVLQAQNAVTKLQDKLNPAQLIPVINGIVKSVETLSKVLNVTSSYLSKLDIVLKTLKTVQITLTVIVKFIRLLPLPARWSTVGVISTLSNIADKQDKKVEQILSNIEQVTFFISTFASALSSINKRINVLIEDLRFLLNNLQKCKKTFDLPVTKNLEQALIVLENNVNNIELIVPKPTTKKQILYKGFALEIVEEEVVDQGIVAIRRYGVALDARGVVKAQTDLTYATNIELIQNELRFLIDKNKLNANPTAASDTSEEDQVRAELDLPSEQEQLDDLAATQAQIDALIKQIAPEENLRKERSKKDKRKFRRLVRVIKRLRTTAILGKNYTKAQIKAKVLNKNRFDQFDETDFEEAWKASTGGVLLVAGK